MFDFKDQVVLITGAGSPRGMGRVFAHSFAGLGAKVVLCDINKEGVDANVKELKEAGFEAAGFAGNLCEEENVTSLADSVVKLYGRIDVLVNNAGISQKVTVADMTLGDMQRIFSVNMFGLFLLTKAVCEVMKKQNYGRIVHLSSVSGKRGFRANRGYRLQKWCIGGIYPSGYGKKISFSDGRGGAAGRAPCRTVRQ